MRCRKVRSFLSTYSKGETSPEVSAEIKGHLENCTSCRREENIYRSMNKLLTELPQKRTSDDFTAKLFAKIGQEGFAERKTRAYWPKRIPVFGAARLATAASVAVVFMVAIIGFGVSDRVLYPNSPQMTSAVPATETGTDDYYLTVQPSDNPLLNEHKSVSRIIAQYNRWREYSKALRVNAGAEQLISGGSGLTLASSHSETPDVIVRPVVKNYLIVP